MRLTTSVCVQCFDGRKSPIVNFFSLHLEKLEYCFDWELGFIIHVLLFCMLNQIFMGFDATIFSGMLEAIQARNFWFGCYFYYWLKWHWCAFACVVEAAIAGNSPVFRSIRSLTFKPFNYPFHDHCNCCRPKIHFPTTIIYFPILTSYTSFNRSIKFHVDCR